MQTVIEVSIFARQADSLFSQGERQDIAAEIANDPKGAPVEPGTGGLRKRRFGLRHKGKRGGARVMYLHFNERAPIYLLLAWGKGMQAKMTPDQKKLARKLVEQIKAEWERQNS